MIHWETDTQQGTEHCPDLASKKSAILAAMGYTSIDISGMVNAFTAYVNGQIGPEELERLLEKEVN